MSNDRDKSNDAKFTEPGRWVDASGTIRYAWPPEGRFKHLWERVVAVTTEEERDVLQSLLSYELQENSTTVAYMDTEDGVWHDLEANWDNPPRWMDGLN